MSKYISITSGTMPILINLIKQNPDHHLNLYKSNTEDTYKLIDWFPQSFIFKAPITYRILLASNPIEPSPFINLFNFTLSHKQQEILTSYIQKQLTSGLPEKMTSLFLAQNTKNSSQIMVGSSWKASDQYLKWIHSSFIHNFLENDTNNGFHDNLIYIR